MNPLSRHRLYFGLVLATGAVVGAAEVGREPSPNVPLARPRLTDTLRAKADDIAREGAPAGGAIVLDRVIVRDRRHLPAGPPKDQPVEGRFSPAQGGYLFKNEGAKFTTEVGLWRHIDLIDERSEALKQSTRIRMGLVRISW